jgi:hypothetical protein
VEVLVAVVILFAGITAILRVYGLAVSALDAADATVAATLAAQQQLDAVPLVSAGSRPGGTLAAAPEPLVGYVCRVTAREAGVEGGALVEYDLRAGRAGAGESVRVSTLAVPAASP